MYAIETIANLSNGKTYHLPKFYVDVDGDGIAITTEDQARTAAEVVLTTVFDLGCQEEGPEVRLNITARKVPPGTLAAMAYIETVEI